MIINAKITSMSVALLVLANIALTDRSDSRAKCFASSAARQYVGPQGGCPAKKLSTRELVAASEINPNPRSGAPIPTRPVTANSVSDSGTTQYPYLKTEDGHGDKGGRASIREHLTESGRVNL